MISTVILAFLTNSILADYTHIPSPKCASHSRGYEVFKLDCPDGKEHDAGLCYKPCPDGYKGVGPVCWKGIKSHPRGVGTPMKADCPADKVYMDVLCFRDCPEHYIQTIHKPFSRGAMERVSSKGTFCTEDPEYFNCVFDEN